MRRGTAQQNEEKSGSSYSENVAFLLALVSQVLRHNEYTIDLSGSEEKEQKIFLGGRMPGPHSVMSVDSNQLASNVPIEDKLAAARCLWTTGFLFGVFDGHAGPECSIVVAKRLFDYVAAALLPKSSLQRLLATWKNGECAALTHMYNDTADFVPEVQKVYQESLRNYCQDLLNERDKVGGWTMEEALIESFRRLDEDISRELLQNQDPQLHELFMGVTMSGSVACVAHIDGPHLHVANVGDCRAVLGVSAETGGWLSQRLTNDHNWENQSELDRVLEEHPPSEAHNVVKNQRLMGILMPFRAFGDFRLKWDQETLEKFNIWNDLVKHIPHYLTPPYLTSAPEVTYHRLHPRERFLVIASDGLWESMDAYEVTTLVGEYMSGRQTLQPVNLPHRPVKLKEIAELLTHREAGYKLKPIDTNAATHLIRHALGITETGLDHARLSHSLALPIEVRRYFRDDISIHVIFFDADFLRLCPVEL
ncbi:pyruvate dehydrogenase [acetyl-transferring]-phosphatase 1-like protein, mitochondrial isoform X2 [Oratosquilla oratoria]|uniref:pyruvate dehydrogenase [acetyl-transferring]-phosphatase 1-like protein, mitochondrial isoform X2 n=1 Tax=Oratosquilla oratoria TaxID=337810 RepID=UPI003F762A32